ncbi:TrmB family transcriptional regulator [Chloroflexus sp.]|uniref:TrmB family transcriptional regulator n=1 Tax=Chloroflexus sp. TaxID=1904827 RepID=UPI002ACEF34B|nr:helix-turn-helix domain-containing protein [Chloroflexus sp.]
MIDQTLEQLMALGLNRYEAATYLALLEHRGFTPAQAAVRAGVPRQRIYDILASLCARGLAIERHSDGQRRYFAVDPAIALPALIDERRRQFEHEQAALTQGIQGLLATLTPIFAAGHDQIDPLDYVDVLLDRRLVVERALALAGSAEREICVCFKLPLLGDKAANFAEVSKPIRRGVGYRAIYERAALADPELRAWVKQFVAWGQQARIVETLPLKVNLYDRRVALLSLQDPVTGTLSFTALCVTHPNFSAFLQGAFEKLWEDGEPFEHH